jgi:multimeric flavodoxin WrbA
MKIAVLNGSPKGSTSVTMQYVHYMQKKLPDLELTIHHVAQRINKLEKDESSFWQIMENIKQSDAVIWAFPLYFMLVASQMKRFIELIFEWDAKDFFSGKYAASLSTSVHFFDHTAHNYIHAICDDLCMRYVDGYSAAMYDLLRGKERQRFLLFAENFKDALQQRVPVVKSYQPLQQNPFIYEPGNVLSSVDTAGKKFLILTDARPENTNLTNMIVTLKKQYLQDIEVVNLHDIDISGGCLGCISCGYDNKCVYFGKDSYQDLFEGMVKKADAIIFTGAMKDRYLSSRWKLFFDRSFYNNHQPVLEGKQIGFLISGPLAQNYNLWEILEAYVECMGGNLVGFVTDESADSAIIDLQLNNLARRLGRLSMQHYVKPRTFLGVGGIKVLRDEIWGNLRFVFLADHRYFKKHGMYDFPQKRYKVRMRNLLMTLLMGVPVARKGIEKRLKEEMIKPLQHVVKNK